LKRRNADPSCDGERRGGGDGCVWQGIGFVGWCGVGRHTIICRTITGRTFRSCWSVCRRRSGLIVGSRVGKEIHQTLRRAQV